MPAVARTDSAKPYERASHGSMRRSSSTVAAKAASPARRRPVTNVASRMVAITAALRTLGCGRARITNPITAMNPITAAARRERPSPRTRPMTTPATIARFAPDTAVRWLRPARRKSSTSASGICPVSPTTSAGTRPRAAGSRPATALRSPARIRDATDWTADSGELTVGGPRGLSTAAVPSSSRGGESRPVVRIRWLGTSSSHRSVAGASSRTGNRTLTWRLPCRSSSARAGTSTAGRPLTGPSRRGWTRAGSPVTTSSSVAISRSCASSDTGPPCTVATLAAAAIETAAPAAHTATTVAAQPERAPPPGRAPPEPVPLPERVRHSASAPTTASPAPSPTVHPAPTTGASQPTIQPDDAGSTSRRSAG